MRGYLPHIDGPIEDICFDLSGMFLGATGAVGVGFYTGFFNKIQPPFLKCVSPQVRKVATTYPLSRVYEKVKRVNKALTGGPLSWRFFKRGALGTFLYCALECKLQGFNVQRRAFDCGVAGAISGALFGARSGLPTAAFTAAGFSAYAIVSYFLYH